MSINGEETFLLKNYKEFLINYICLFDYLFISP